MYYGYWRSAGHEDGGSDRQGAGEGEIDRQGEYKEEKTGYRQNNGERGLAGE